MAVLEVLIVGMVTAFMNIPESANIKPSNSNRLKSMAVADKDQRAHRQSLCTCSDRTRADNPSPKKSDLRSLGALEMDALASVAFDDDVELLLSHGW
ncbi:hypothetical protein N7G274_000179 [Stereocaulon virgatum]|uniref:Uncharacterized protein n=1 Tax=Stereocaulon virgatum TaxID=373712 RepID=A0ABR4ARE6_9LECA